MPRSARQGKLPQPSLEGLEAPDKPDQAAKQGEVAKQGAAKPGQPAKPEKSGIETPEKSKPAAVAGKPAAAAPRVKPGQKLFLVDAMGFIFRAFFAPMARLSNPAGLPTKVPYLFSTMLRKLIKEFQPDYLAVVFDPSGPTFRDALFAQYKAQRPPMPDELSVQLPFVRRLCKAMCLPMVEISGYEADDVIGALAHQGAERKLDVYIVTSDKDMLQLVGGPVHVLRPGQGGGKGDLLVDSAKVEELLGVPPDKVADVMALMGDSIDNIPGAKGIGEKGAKELILRFGSAEAALERAAEVEGKRYREALLNSREQVLLSKQLAKISAQAPVELDLDALASRQPDWQALRDLYTELGFTSLLRDLPAVATAPAYETDYATLDSPAALREFLARVPKENPLAVWLALDIGEREMEGFGARVTCLEVSSQPGVARIAPCTESGEMLAALGDFLGDPARPKIVHDPKLLHLLAGGSVAGIRDATAIYSYLLRPSTATHDLPAVALRYLNVALTGAPGESADHLQRLAPLLRAEVESKDLAGVYDTIDLPLAPVLAAMEREGVRIDHAALAAMSTTLETQIRDLERTIWDLAAQEFNINSPAQLAEILFDKMNLAPAGRRGRGARARSTAADILAELALIHELPKKVLEYRELSKLKGTYVDALPCLIDPQTGRLHTRLSQTTAATGRLSSSDPNLQNIPVRTELGREIRAAFVAEPGWTLLSADYSQIELRILAHFSGDPVLLEAFGAGQDVHSRTAQEVFGVGPLAQTAEHRRVAKVINFGIVYGLSPFGLAQQLGIEQKEAARFIASYFERYAAVKKYLERSLEETRRNGFTRTLFGRIRPIPEITAPQGNLRSLAERAALNTPLQGTAADLVKLAMIAIDRELAAQKLHSRMILQVHDELLFEAPPEEMDRLPALVRSLMEGAATLAVPLRVEMKSGPNWRDLKPLEKG